MGCSKLPETPCPYLHAGSHFTCPNYCRFFFVEGTINYFSTGDQRTPLSSYSHDELLGEIRRRCGP